MSSRLRELQYSATLLSRTAYAANGTFFGPAIKLPAPQKQVIAMLNIVVATAAGSIDVYVESRIGSSGSWIEAHHFDQLTSVDTPRQRYTTISARDLATLVHDSTSVLVENTGRNLALGEYRIKVVVAGGASATIEVLVTVL